MEDLIRSVASANSEPTNWAWPDDCRSQWPLQSSQWQQFADKWRNAEEEELHPRSQVLDLGPRDLVPGIINVNRLFVRECYVEAEKLIWEKAAEQRRTGVIITGQPGIGKTVFIWYLLICLLQKKQVVLLHVSDMQDSILFRHDGVFVAKPAVTSDVLPFPSTNLARPPFIWSLSDMHDRREPPIAATTYEWCFPVQAPSPRQERYQVWRKARNPLFTGFPLWTREELIQSTRLGVNYPAIMKNLRRVVAHWKDENAGMPSFLDTFHFLKEIHGEDAPESADEAFDILLDGLIERFGPIIRDIHHAMVNLSSLERQHRGALSISFEELYTVVESLRRKEFPHESTFDRIISLNHAKELENESAWQIAFKSVFIGKQVSRRLFEERETVAPRWIGFFFTFPETKDLAEQLFEPLARRTIMGTAGDDAWSLRKMNLQGHSDHPCFVLPDLAPRAAGFSKFQRTAVAFDPTKIPADFQHDKYYIPRVPNLLFFDSFLVNLDFLRGTADIWILQMTTSTDHRGSPKGYEVIRKIVERVRELLRKGVNPDEPPPAKKAKTSDVKVSIRVHYVLVRPDHHGRSIWMLPKGWDTSTTRNDHRGDGYVLDIPVLSADEKRQSEEPCH